MSPLDYLAAAIQKVAPASDCLRLANTLRPHMEAEGIGTTHRIAAFVGQCSVESMKFSRTEESLYYTADRMCEVWPSRFPTIESAGPCALNPEVLANNVYANRMGNGDPASGDGWTFRGAGYIQLTGRAAQTAFAVVSGQPINTVGAYLRTPQGAAESACWYWADRRLNALADAWEITSLSRVINGGSGGFLARLAACNAALKAISA